MASIVNSLGPVRKKVALQIINGSLWQEPCVEGDITLETERKGSPGTLKFKVLKDDVLNIQEGNPVKFMVNDKNIFFGFIFTKGRGKEQIISITAYDQLRYFKNKDTYKYKNLTAGALLKMLCEVFKLKWGNVEDTKYVIPSRIEDNTTLFDAMQYAIDETLRNKKQMYVLYDDFGKLALKNIENMKLDLIIDAETGEELDYQTSIDSNTYNKIKLINEEGGKVYTSKDMEHMKQWGVLQYTDTVDSNTNGQIKADTLLKLYNTKTRNLTVKNAFGDIRVRGGSMVVVKLNLGDINVLNYMLVEKVKHTFSNGHHSMDLYLSGGTHKGVQFSV